MEQSKIIDTLRRISLRRPGGEGVQKGKLSLSDDSDSDTEDIPKPRPRTKPLTES